MQNLRAFNRYKNSLDNDINILHVYKVEIAEWKIYGEISTIAKISEKVIVSETNKHPIPALTNQRSTTSLILLRCYAFISAI